MDTKITILGSGSQDSYSQALEANVRCALSDMGLEADVEHVTDERRIAKYDLTETPALLINDKLIATDRAPSCEEIKSLLLNTLKH